MARIAVVGAGAIGGFIAAALARAGEPVRVVARGEHGAAIRRHGLCVESELGNFSVPLDVASDLRDLGPGAFLLLTFKAHQWPGAMELLAGAPGDATLVTLQNGLPFWYVREPPLRSVDPGGEIGRRFPDSRVVGAVVHVSGTVAAPGRIRQSGGRRYVFGDPGGGSGARVNELLQIFARAGLAPEADARIRQTIWLKLVNNAGLNAVSVLQQMTIKEMLASAPAREQVKRLMEETLAVGRALGVIGAVDVEDRLEYAARLNDVKTSMLQDYERQRPLELDPILCAVCELGERLGVATPAVRAAYEALR